MTEEKKRKKESAVVCIEKKSENGNIRRGPYDDLAAARKMKRDLPPGSYEILKIYDCFEVGERQETVRSVVARKPVVTGDISDAVVSEAASGEAEAEGPGEEA